MTVTLPHAQVLPQTNDIRLSGGSGLNTSTSATPQVNRRLRPIRESLLCALGQTTQFLCSSWVVGGTKA